MSDADKQSAAARKMLLHLNASEIDQIECWLKGLLFIRDSEDNYKSKLNKTIEFTKINSPLKPIVKLFAKTCKEHLWDKRGLATRYGGMAMAGSLLFFGPQGAGLAAFGTAIGIPLFIVFGAGGVFAGVVLEEIARSKANHSQQEKIDIK
jgi:hypothetical protein